MENKKLTIKPLDPSLATSKAALRKSPSRDHLGTHSLEIGNLPDNVTEDVLRMFFENVRRSGGGDVKRIIHRQENNTAIITFHSSDGKAICNLY